MANVGFGAVEVKGVVKDYGRQRALFGVSLRLPAGEGTVLLGDNGAGKSTLLGVLGTLIKPTRGTVRYGGHTIAELEQESLRGQIGYLSHEVRCYGDLTARENLMFFGRLYGYRGARGLPAADGDRGADLDAGVAAMLGRVGLEGAADRPVRTFSRGMLQRLAVARTLLHRPALLLLDEPFTGLDRGGVALLTSLLEEERRRGAILLLTSHDLGAVAPLCDQALLLRRGRLLRERRYERGACTGEDLARLYDQRDEGPAAPKGGAAAAPAAAEASP